MGIVVTNSTIRALNTTVRASFFSSYEASAQTTLYRQLATIEPSGSRSNTYPYCIDSGAIREFTGERHINSLAQGTFVVTNKRWELTWGINKDDVADDETGTLMRKVRQGGAKFAQHPDKLLAAVLSANPTCMDGLALFHATHYRDPSNTSGSTYANTFTGMPLTSANAALARATGLSLLAPDGEPLSPNLRTLLVPPSLEAEARRIAQAVYLPSDAGTASQDNIWRGVFNVIVWPRLEAISSTTWYLCDLDSGERPLIFQERDPLEFTTQFNPDDPQVFMRNEWLWGGTYRAVAAAGVPYRIFRCAP